MDQDTQSDNGVAPEQNTTAAEPMQSTASASTASEPVATPAAAAASTDDLSDHKLYAILGYIIPFLFFLPLLQDSSKNNAFARFHANQQLLILIILVSFWALNNVLFMILYFIWFAIAPLISLAILVLVIIGVINAAKGEMKELPLIGKFRLLK
jgi:uncharacterized membrane protein